MDLPPVPAPVNCVSASMRLRSIQTHPSVSARENCDENFTKHLAKPPHEDQAAALAHYAEIFNHPLTWDDLRWIREHTTLP
ncbi:MAG TPA: hypothetical protein VMB04_26910, partial [Mycobacterium sp.]|nr:hypothetical protein [Mycobacterium sp.]